MSKTVAELLVGVLEQVGVTKRTGSEDRTATETTMSAHMSKIVDAVEAWYRQHGTLHFYVWLGLIALKTHLKGSQAPGTLGCT